MDGVRARLLGGGDDGVLIQIALARGGWANAEGLLGRADEERRPLVTPREMAQAAREALDAILERMHKDEPALFLEDEARKSD